MTDDDDLKLCPILSQMFDDGELRRFHCEEKDCAGWLITEKTCGMMPELLHRKGRNRKFFTPKELKQRQEEFKHKKELKELGRMMPEDLKDISLNEEGEIIVEKKEEQLKFKSDEKTDDKK